MPMTRRPWSYRGNLLSQVEVEVGGIEGAECAVSPWKCNAMRCAAVGASQVVVIMGLLLPITRVSGVSSSRCRGVWYGGGGVGMGMELKQIGIVFSTSVKSASRWFTSR